MHLGSKVKTQGKLLCLQHTHTLTHESLANAKANLKAEEEERKSAYFFLFLQHASGVLCVPFALEN